MNKDTVRKHIDRGNAAWIEAFRSSDSHKLAGLFDDGGVMLGGEGKFSQGRDEIAAAISKTMNSFGPTETTIDTDGVWLVDDIAYETGRYGYTFTPKDSSESKTYNGRYVVNWKRQKDGSWKIAMDMGLPD